MYEPLWEGLERTEEGGLNNLDGCLAEAMSCLDSLGSGYSDNKSALNLLSGRLKEGQFRLAVLGQFKRGKSTLLNALLGDTVLPTDILPVTAIPTFISYSDTLTAQVHFVSERESKSFSTSQDGSMANFLAEYVTEAGNPNNKNQVERVEIGHPAELLQNGVVLIDTPGIGSTYKHNTEVAYQILPQCDAALFLVSPDPPITEVELDYLREICQQLPRTFYLLNKIDFLDDSDRVASLSFLADQLTPLLNSVPQILPVSARKGLNARLNEDIDGWKQSGMYQVDQNLIDFFAKEKQQILQDSIRKKITDQINHISLQVQLSLRALTLSEGELRQRIEQFRSSLPAVEREKLAAKDVLSGDLKRLEADLTKEVEQTRSKAKETITAELEVLFQTVSDSEELERQVRSKLADAIPRFFAPELNRVSDAIQQQGSNLLTLHQNRSNELIEMVRKNAAELFDIPYHAPSAAESTTTFSAPSWSSDLFISDMDPLGQKLSRKFLTYKFRHRRTIARLRDAGRKLIGENVEQINWAVRRGIDESFRQFGTNLTEQLNKTVTATRSAMEVALKKNESRAFETAEQELHLRQVFESLQRILGQLDQSSQNKEKCL
jgi:GTPase Era involved in 16S rRNA processing